VGASYGSAGSTVALAPLAGFVGRGEVINHFPPLTLANGVAAAEVYFGELG
jgi:hypothetical protein